METKEQFTFKRWTSSLSGFSCKPVLNLAKVGGGKLKI